MLYRLVQEVEDIVLENHWDDMIPAVKDFVDEEYRLTPYRALPLLRRYDNGTKYSCLPNDNEEFEQSVAYRLLCQMIEWRCNYACDMHMDKNGTYQEYGIPYEQVEHMYFMSTDANAAIMDEKRCAVEVLLVMSDWILPLYYPLAVDECKNSSNMLKYTMQVINENPDLLLCVAAPLTPNLTVLSDGTYGACFCNTAGELFQVALTGKDIQLYLASVRTVPCIIALTDEEDEEYSYLADDDDDGDDKKDIFDDGVFDDDDDDDYEDYENDEADENELNENETDED